MITIKNKLRKKGIALAILVSLMGCKKNEQHLHGEIYNEIWLKDSAYADTSGNGGIEFKEVLNVYSLAGKPNLKFWISHRITLQPLNYKESLRARDSLKVYKK